MAAVPSIGRATGVQRQHAAAPEADATRTLYERYHRQIYNYCLHQLGNREEAEDAVQGTFLNAFRGFKRGITPEHESAWVFKIAENVCLTRRRASFRRGRVEWASDFQELQDVIPGHTADGDGELMGLTEALSAMPEQQRTAILLREWQGLSYKEIAGEMGLTQGAVETLIFRARRTLAQGLTDPEAKTGKRRWKHAVDVGSLLAGLKTFLGGSAAVKVAATVAVATTVTTAGTVAATQAKSGPARPKPAMVVEHVSPLAVAPAVFEVALDPRAVRPAAVERTRAAKPKPARAVAETARRPARSQVVAPVVDVPAAAAVVEQGASPPPAAPVEQPAATPAAAAPVATPSAPAAQPAPRAPEAKHEQPKAEHPKSEGLPGNGSGNGNGVGNSEAKAEEKAEQKAEKAEAKAEVKSAAPAAPAAKEEARAERAAEKEARQEERAAEKEAKKEDLPPPAAPPAPAVSPPAPAPLAVQAPPAVAPPVAAAPETPKQEHAAEKAVRKEEQPAANGNGNGKGK